MSTIQELKSQYESLIKERNYEVNNIFRLHEQVDFVQDCASQLGKDSHIDIIRR